MKLKTYAIYGVNNNHHLGVVYLTGPARPALSTLLKQFEAQSNTPPKTKPKLTGPIDARMLIENIHNQALAEEYWKTEGYQGRNLGEIFVDWLRLNCGFEDADVTDFYF